MATHAQNRPLGGEPGRVLQMEPRCPRQPRGRVAAVLLVLGLIALIAPSYVHLNQFQDRLANTLSNTLGREVSVRDVRLRLLPRPGFLIKGLSIADDEGFSAEPMIRSEEVTAWLRISSIWRGRLEIASLSLQQPSLNLVRNQSGRWNIEALLERAAQTPTAPTGKTRAEARPRFPYIEAEDGRINFKFGQEKKVYALAGTDFALWLASENEWSMRLAGQPIRTDANLGNTGKLRVEGSFRRAADLRATPLKIDLKLDDAQLGQLTHLVYGLDRGWRGAVRLSATLNGTPADFTVSTDARVSDFRRYDIATAERLTLQAHCDAHYRVGHLGAVTSRNFFLNSQCHSPVQDGQVVLHAELSPAQPEPMLNLMAVSVPVSSIAAFFRHAKKDVAEDFSASGTLSGNMAWQNGELGGSWIASAVRLRSDALNQPLTVGNLILSIQQEQPPRGSAARWDRAWIRVLPFSVSLDAPAPVNVQAAFSRTEYKLTLNGMADTERLAALFQTLGLQMPAGAPTEGLARTDLQVSGTWARFAAPTTAGIVRPQSASVARAGIKQ